MVGEIDLGRGRRRFGIKIGLGRGRRRIGIEIDVCYGGIGPPRLTGVFEIIPHTSPLVPNQDTIESDEEESGAKKDNDSNSTDVDQVTFNVVNNGGVEFITE